MNVSKLVITVLFSSIALTLCYCRDRFVEMIEPLDLLEPVEGTVFCNPDSITFSWRNISDGDESYIFYLNGKILHKFDSDEIDNITLPSSTFKSGKNIWGVIAQNDFQKQPSLPRKLYVYGETIGPHIYSEDVCEAQGPLRINFGHGSNVSFIVINNQKYPVVNDSVTIDITGWEVGTYYWTYNTYPDEEYENYGSCSTNFDQEVKIFGLPAPITSTTSPPGGIENYRGELKWTCDKNSGIEFEIELYKGDCITGILMPGWPKTTHDKITSIETGDLYAGNDNLGQKYCWRVRVKQKDCFVNWYYATPFFVRKPYYTCIGDTIGQLTWTNVTPPGWSVYQNGGHAPAITGIYDPTNQNLLILFRDYYLNQMYTTNQAVIIDTSDPYNLTYTDITTQVYEPTLFHDFTFECIEGSLTLDNLANRALFLPPRSHSNNTKTFALDFTSFLTTPFKIIETSIVEPGLLAHHPNGCAFDYKRNHLLYFGFNSRIACHDYLFNISRNILQLDLNSNPAIWTELVPETSASPLINNIQIGYSADLDAILFYGGIQYDKNCDFLPYPSSDLWKFTLADNSYDWHLLHPDGTKVPPGLRLHAQEMISPNRYLITHGYHGILLPTKYPFINDMSNDTYIYNTSTNEWEDIDIDNTIMPPVNAGIDTAFDPERCLLWVFGGFYKPERNEIWMLSGF